MAATRKILDMVRTMLASRSIVDGRFRPACRVSLADVVSTSGCPRRPVLRVLDRLAREGWLEIMSEERVPAEATGETFGPARRNPTYQVVKDIRLHRAHQVRTRISCRDKIWTTLRTLRSATVADLQRLTGCAYEAVQDYIKVLRRHGIVKSGAKVAGNEKAYVLLKDAGPRRPETPEKHASRREEDK